MHLKLRVRRFCNGPSTFSVLPVRHTSPFSEFSLLCVVFCTTNFNMHENMSNVWLPMHYCTIPLGVFFAMRRQFNVFSVTVLVFVTMLSFDTGVFLLWSMNLLVTSGNCFFIYISIPCVSNLNNTPVKKLSSFWKNYLPVIFWKAFPAWQWNNLDLL